MPIRMAHVSAQALITRAGVTRRTACVSSLVEPRYSVRHAEMCAAVCLHAHTQSHSVMRCKGQLTLLAHNCAACISARMIWRRMTDQHRTTRLAARVPPLVCACTESTPQLPGGLYALRCVLGAVLCSQGRVRPACCAAGRCGAEHRRAAHRRLKTKWSLLECRCMLPDFPDLIDPCHLPACPCAHHACLSLSRTWPTLRCNFTTDEADNKPRTGLQGNGHAGSSCLVPTRPGATPGP